MEPGKATILHVIGQLGLGGAERQLFLLVRKLSDRYGFIIISYDPDHAQYVDALREIGATVFVIPRQNGIGGRLRFLLKIRDIIREASPEIVQTWLISANFWGRAAYLCARPQKPLIASIRNVKEARYYVLSRILDRILSRWTNIVICNTHAAKASLLRYGISPAKIRVIHNGIEPDKYDVSISKKTIRQRLGIPQENFVIGTIGRITRQKNYPLFVSMAETLLKRNSHLHFIVVGNGELRPQTERMIEERGLRNRFTLTGARNDIADVLKAFDLFILTSNWEGFPNVLLEAMCGRVPVIATAVGGVAELVQDGANGLLVEPGDLEGLVRAVETLVSDTERRTRLGDAGRRSIENHYTLGHMAERTAAIYEELMAGRNKGSLR